MLRRKTFHSYKDSLTNSMAYWPLLNDSERYVSRSSFMRRSVAWIEACAVPWNYSNCIVSCQLLKFWTVSPSCCLLCGSSEVCSKFLSAEHLSRCPPRYAFSAVHLLLNDSLYLHPKNIQTSSLRFHHLIHIQVFRFLMSNDYLLPNPTKTIKYYLTAN